MFAKILSSAYAVQPGSPMAPRRSPEVALPTLTSSCFMCRKACIQQSKKDIVAKKILIMSAEATL